MTARPDRRLRDELARLAAAGHDVFLEIGAQPGLTATIRESVARSQASPLILSSLRGGDRGLESLRWSAASLYAAGFDIDWSRVSPRGALRPPAPYPWRRERYWLDEEATARDHRPPEAIRTIDVSSPPTLTNGHTHGRVAASVGMALAGGPAAGRSAGLLEALRAGVAALLGVSPEQVDPDRSLIAMGLDSITAMELKADIDAYLGASLPLEVLIDASSLREVAERAGDFIGQGADEALHRAEPPTPASARPLRDLMDGGEGKECLPRDRLPWDIPIQDVHQLDEAELDMLIERLT